MNSCGLHFFFFFCSHFSCSVASTTYTWKQIPTHTLIKWSKSYHPTKQLLQLSHSPMPTEPWQPNIRRRRKRRQKSATCTQILAGYLECCMFFVQTRKFFPTNVWPNCQLDGAMFQEVEERWSLPLTRNESDWPVNSAFVCQFWPQFLLMSIHPVFEPFTRTLTMSPAPPTLVIRTRLKKRWPLIVNRIPPCFLQGTLREISQNPGLV